MIWRMAARSRAFWSAFMRCNYRVMTRVGVVPMSAKPYHVGHDMLVRLAASECEEVVVFVSEADRARKGEFPVKGETMRDVWSDHILATLPDNVYVQFVPNPVTAVYRLTGDADADPNDLQTYAIYSDPTDMERNFPPRSVSKYMPNLVARQRVVRRLVMREATADVSGTQMRAWLQHGDKARFVAHLPASLDGEAVWAKLSRR